jgi:glycine/D-amino acid oxidase-like deaminating enzyme
VFPQLADVKMEYAWGGHIDITMRRMPDWGRRDDRVFWAQGFCGHGLVPTRVGGKLVSDAVLGKTEELDWFSKIVNPPFPGGRGDRRLMQAVGCRTTGCATSSDRAPVTAASPCESGTA